MAPAKKAKAPKGVKESRNPPDTSSLSSLGMVARCAAVCIANSLAVNAARRAMHPLYGTGATNTFYLPVWLGTAILSSLVSGLLSTSTPNTLMFAGLYLALGPVWGYWIAVYTGRIGHVVVGSVGTLITVLGPLQWVCTQLLMNEVAQGSRSSVLHRALLGAVNYAISVYLQMIWDRLPLAHPSFIFFALSTLALPAWAVTLFSAPSSALTRGQRSSRVSRAVLLSILYPAAVVFTASQPPTRPLPILFPAPLSESDSPSLYPYYAHPTHHAVRILHSSPSLTGQLVIGENHDVNIGGGIASAFRYMRVDHSLIGGVWLGVAGARMDDRTPAIKDEWGVELGDPIYSTFVLQEAVRLARREDGTKPRSALVIGLGAGISANALMQHGLHTTVLELDPGVYDTALRFFGLREPDAVYLQDAEAWVREAAVNVSSRVVVADDAKRLFDVVIHDVFSGGGVPSQLFTHEFWGQLKALTAPQGVIAVNFAGVLGSESARSVVTTLQASFPHCRAFHDYLEPPTDKQLVTEFINVVIFCTPSSHPLTFRPARQEDFLSSFLRQRMLTDLEWRELDLRRIKGDWPPLHSQPGAGDASEGANEGEETKWLLTAAHDPLAAAQRAMALEHWSVMRGVLPDVFWETY